MSIKETYDYYAKEGYLTAIPNGRLTLYNYTFKTVMSGNWNYHTQTARGLILDMNGDVVARPFPKFWNLNERPESHAHNLPAEVPELSQKYDGSLIIAFWNRDHWQSVTMGCWDNMQTQFANKWLEEHGHKLSRDYTYMFELVAPWNRIVVEYLEEKMILVGIMHTQGGFDLSYKLVREFGLSKGFDAVEFENKPINSINTEDNVTNVEGFVARFANGLRVKIKYDQYIQLHKILTGLSIKGIWEMLRDKRNLEALNIPNEFLEWFNTERVKIQSSFEEHKKNIWEIFKARPNTGFRKDDAIYFRKTPQYESILFILLDGGKYEQGIWKIVKPENHKTFQKDQE